MAHDGRPGGLLAIKGEVDDADAEELRNRFSGGPTQAGRTAVIEAEDVTWVDTALSPRDAQYVQSRGLTKEEILLALGVPETIIGNASQRTFDNADAEREVFWQETMSSHLSLIEHGLEGLTKGGYDDDVLLWHDTSKIEVLKRAEEQKREKAQAEYDRGLISIAEYREITGRDKVDAPGARVLWIAGGKAPVGDEKDQEAAGKLPVIGPAPAPAPGAPAPGLTSRPGPGEQPGRGDRWHPDRPCAARRVRQEGRPAVLQDRLDDRARAGPPDVRPAARARGARRPARHPGLPGIRPDQPGRPGEGDERGHLRPGQHRAPDR